MFNNKFNRILPHPGYNIEGMAMGALIGGGTALVTGQDVLTGALLGAGTSGLTQGAQGLLGATNTAAMTGVDTAIDTGVGIGTDAAREAAINSQIASSQAMLQPSTTAIGGITSEAGRGLASTTVPNAVSQGAYPNFAANVAPQGAVSNVVLPGAQQGIASTAQAATQPGLFAQTRDWYNTLSPLEKAGVGIGGGALLSSAMAPGMDIPEEDEYDGVLKRFKYDPRTFKPSRISPNVYNSGYAQGGIAALAGGGYPMGMQNNTQFATPSQMPMSAEVVNADYEPVEMAMGGTAMGNNPNSFGMANFGTGTGAMYGNPNGFGMANFGRGWFKPKSKGSASLANFKPMRNDGPRTEAGSHIYKPQYAKGGIAGYNLGGYAAGGNPRLLKGPGDGMSDDIPATIANKQPARLADGEFVVPADVVSHLGNGSTDAGAKHLYKMMDKVRKARTGKKTQGKQIKSDKFLPA